MVPEDIKRILFRLLCCIGVAAFLATCFLSLQSHTRRSYMNIDQNKTVEVSQVRLRTLRSKEAMLDALIAEGVEDWEGYFSATERLRGRGDNHEDGI